MFHRRRFVELTGAFFEWSKENIPDVDLCYKGVLDKDGKVVFEETADFLDGIKPDAAEQFPIDTTVEAPRFELDHKDGKIKGDTGKFIERL